MTRTVLPGDVFYIKCSFPEVTKKKYLVLAKTQPNRFFVINSQINKYMESDSSILICQVDVPHLGHSTFLSHDSIADCSNIIDTHSVINDSQIIFNNLVDFRVGRIADYVVSNIIDNLEEHNKTIKTKERKIIIASLKESIAPAETEIIIPTDTRTEIVPPIERI